MDIRNSIKTFFPLRSATNTVLTFYPNSPIHTNTTPTRDGQLMIKAYYIMMTVFGYQILTISDSEFYSIIMTTLSLVIMVKTKHWFLSKGIIHGPVFERSSRTIVSLAQLGLDPKLPDIDHMVISNNFLFPKSCGT